MSTTAQTASIPRTPSTRRQAPPPTSYPNNIPDPDRPHRTQSTSSRPNPVSNSPRRAASTSQTTAPQSLRNGQQRDYEQTNVAQPDNSRISESSYDRPAGGATHSRTESKRENAAGHSRTHSRYTDQPTPAPAPNMNGTTAAEHTRTGSASNPPPNMRTKRTAIDATTGHWELGKTIGAGSMGKVKLARNKETGEQVAVKIVPRNSSDSEHRTPAERERADHSKEVRTQREASIVTLVDHPYICGMRDVLRTNYHWYMLFEYVNGGQMLDYIISHGRLKEKQARKFGRQIASALDYCHRNSIVHRDLKIENILISKTGDIKIIDFGLSNLFSPKDHLKTFCGSLYFAAPELLQAKQYTGPEVDVWSFGIVLYVLVCGKVPFDDQSMPQLHAKIKKGHVEYPPWLTPECKNLIARMLTTNPAERAPLQEIMNHPWMTKGFNGPPDNYLTPRKPLQLPLDSAVIDKMTGFDFGSADVITAQLTKIIESEEYQRAIRMAERKNVKQTSETEKKRGVLDFYKRRNSISSRDTLNTPSSEAVQLGQDPVNAFHPYISIYYLAQEKIEREAKEKNPGALSMPQEPGEKPLKVPDMPSAPEAAYTNHHAAETVGENPSGGRSRPRARTQGEDEVQAGLQNLNVTTAPNPTIVEPEQQPQQRKESTAVGLLRRLSTRRNKEPSNERDRERQPSHPPPALAAYGNSEAPGRSFSVRRTRERERDTTPTGSRPGSSRGTGEKAEGLAPQATAPAASGDVTTTPGEKSPSKRSYGLGRSISVNSSDMRRRLTRRGASEGSSLRPTFDQRAPSMDTARRVEDSTASSDAEGAPSRPQTGGASRARSMGHARKESMPLPRRNIRPDTTRTSDVPEETDAELADEIDGSNGRTRNTGSPGENFKDMKPIYLKGLFSVSTTSNRPLTFIRADIIRVLRMLGVEFKEIKGGFSCRHAPSIVPSTEKEGEEMVAPSGAVAVSGIDSDGYGTPNHQRKVSFNRPPGAASSTKRHTRDPSTQTQTPYYQSQQAWEESDSEIENGNETPRVLAPRPTISAPRAPGETSTQVQSDLGRRDMVLKFEIFVVKVPLLSLHGIQFKKVDGGTWQYKSLASRILEELRL